jgi:hypothetical protein
MSCTYKLFTDCYETLYVGPTYDAMYMHVLEFEKFNFPIQGIIVSTKIWLLLKLLATFKSRFVNRLRVDLEG